MAYVRVFGRQVAKSARELSAQEITIVSGGGPGDGIVISIGEDGCSTFTMNADAESGQWDEMDV